MSRRRERRRPATPLALVPKDKPEPARIVGSGRAPVVVFRVAPRVWHAACRLCPAASFPYTEWHRAYIIGYGHAHRHTINAGRVV